MNTNEELISSLVKAGVLKTPRIIEAFRVFDRAKFVLPEYTDEAYEDRPLPIGFGQTISQPTTVAFMLELLQAQEGDHVLDIGSGSGWTTALLSYLVGEKGGVIGLEIHSELVELGKKHLAAYQLSNAQIAQAERGFVGLSGHLFDKILVSAAAAEIPQDLIDELHPGGRMVIPILNSLFTIDKKGNDQLRLYEYYGFVFVPLMREF